MTGRHAGSARGLGRRAARLVWLGAWLLPGPAGASEAQPMRIVFVGDSLVNRSQQDHGLLALVKQDLERSRPDLAFELVNAGVNGNCIADIRARLTRDVLARQPAAVVLWLRQNATPDDRDSRLLTEDGEHLNAAGVALVAGEISAALATQWEAPAHTARAGRTAELPPLRSGSPADTSGSTP